MAILRPGYIDRYKITQGFNIPYPGTNILHTGYDYATPAGIPITAIESGIITYDDDLDDKDGIGVVIQGDHGRWRYWHFSSNTIKKSDKVKAGQVIGYAGDSGISSGPHTHVDLYNDGKFIDYYKILPPKEVNMDWLTDLEKTYLNPTLKAIGMKDWLKKPVSEKMKVLSDIAKTTKDLKKRIEILEKDQSDKYVKVNDLYIKK